MEIIEQFIRGKRPDQSLCEDGFIVTPNYAAVIDGSTSKVEGRNGGKQAMLLVRSAIQTLEADASKAEVIAHLTQALASHNPPEAAADAAYRLTCSAVVYSRALRRVWMIGDCQCRWMGSTHTNHKLVDKVLTQVRCDATTYLLHHGHSAESLLQHDLGRAFILDELRMQTNFQNDHTAGNIFAYAVLDGTPVDDNRVLEFNIPPEVSKLILASDGYPTLCDTLEESEAILADLLQKDSLCIADNAGTKGLKEGNLSFDDRCYLSVRI